jgi:WS/DGAT/MGAT family acyltransferase
MSPQLESSLPGPVLAARWFTPHREAMSGADAAWFHMDREHNLMVVNTVLCFDQRPDWDEAERLLQTRAADRFHRFRQRGVEPPVTLGLLTPWWEDDESFDIRRHVTRIDLSACADRRALDQHVEEQSTVDLDRRHPLWRVELIDLPAGAAALLLRTHHAIGDGAAVFKVIMALTDSVEQPPAARRVAAPSSWTAVDPLAVQRTAVAMATLTERLFRRGATPALRSPLVGQKQVAHLEPIELRQLKEAGRATGSTVNDVFLAALAGAFREHFAELGIDPADVDVSMPVSVRDQRRDGRDELGNRFGLVFIRLPVGIADRRERRALVTERTCALKSSQEPEVVFGGLSALGHFPRGMQNAWVDAFCGDAAAVVTNVPGPRSALSIAGVPVSRMYFFVPSTGPVGLGVSFLSYNGNAIVSLIADRATLPVLEPFAARLEQELHRP